MDHLPFHASGFRSRLTRARGLKPIERPTPRVSSGVAPYAGAWIETSSPRTTLPSALVAPYAGAWIETYSTHSRPTSSNVAPYAGAWIETSTTRSRRSPRSCSSRLTRARGLKREAPRYRARCGRVAPTRAWIETHEWLGLVKVRGSRLTRARELKRERDGESRAVGPGRPLTGASGPNVVR